MSDAAPGGEGPLLHVVLFEPEKAGNVGNVARTCAVLGAELHLIRPFGFHLHDREFRRAVMDYMQGVTLRESLDAIREVYGFDYAIDMSVWDTAEWWPYAYAPMLQSFGGDLIDRDGYETADGFINGDKAVEWGTWFRSLFTDKYASETPAKDGQDFLQGKVPLVYAGGWKVLKAQETFGEDDVLILPPVDFGEGAHVGGGSWQWGVSSSSKNAEAANKFIEFLMQDEYLVQYSDAIGNFPSVESATPKTKYYGEGKPLEPVYEIGKKYALLRPATPGYKVISSVFDKAARDIVSGSDVKSTLDQAAKDIDADIKSNGGYKAK